MFELLLILTFAIYIIDHHFSHYYVTKTIIDKLIQCPYCLSFWGGAVLYYFTNTQINVVSMLVSMIAGYTLQIIWQKINPLIK